jgi:hypothetical protein
MSVRLPTCDGSRFLSAMAVVLIQDFVHNNTFCYFSQRSICFVDVLGFKQVKLHMSYLYQDSGKFTGRTLGEAWHLCKAGKPHKI